QDGPLGRDPDISVDTVSGAVLHVAHDEAPLSDVSCPVRSRARDSGLVRSHARASARSLKLLKGSLATSWMAVSAKPIDGLSETTAKRFTLSARVFAGAFAASIASRVKLVRSVAS